MTARTAYGLDTPRGAHWTASAACNGPGVEPEWFWPTEHAAPTAPTTVTRLAVHLCRRHCPVLGRCDRWAQERPPRYPVVLGGQYYATQAGRVRPAELVESDVRTDCPYCEVTS